MEKTDKTPKIVIGIPSRGIWPSAFAQTVNGATIGNGKLFEGMFAFPDWHITDDARNTVAQTALDKDFDFVFFMDSDMSFPKGALAMLFRHRLYLDDDVAVIGGIYCSRSNDHRWHVYDWEEEKACWKSKRFNLNSGLHKVDAIGTGCMLIDVNVFKILGMPWFEYKYQQIEGKWERQSEDMVFCNKCKEAGIPIYADSEVICGHFHSVQIIPTHEGGYEVKTLQGDVY